MEELITQFVCNWYDEYNDKWRISSVKDTEEKAIDYGNKKSNCFYVTEINLIGSNIVSMKIVFCT